nr:hypothetical protein [Tanacetum cinerariifolium]
MLAGVILGRSFLRLTKRKVDFGNGIITIYPGLVSLNDDFGNDWEAILASVDDSNLPQPDVIDVATFVNNMGKKPRPVIKTLKFSDQHKKLPDNVLLDRLKLDGELELKEEVAIKEVIRSYKAIKEKNDPKVRNNHGESNIDDEEEYYLKRDDNGKPFYVPNSAKYLNCDDPMDRALALQE